MSAGDGFFVRIKALFDRLPDESVLRVDRRAGSESILKTDDSAAASEAGKAVRRRRDRSRWRWWNAG